MVTVAEWRLIFHVTNDIFFIEEDIIKFGCHMPHLQVMSAISDCMAIEYLNIIFNNVSSIIM